MNLQQLRLVVIKSQAEGTEEMCKIVERDRLEVGNSLGHKIDVQILHIISNYMIRTF